MMGLSQKAIEILRQVYDAPFDSPVEGLKAKGLLK